MTESMETGAEIIRAFVKTLPSAPGVYRMIDEAGEVMYVGKARSLKARVTNYTRPEQLEVRLQRMIAATRTMEFVRTETEAEALLLEANLIKRLKPRFNVLLRDDKSFPYILIATEHEAPELTKHRGTKRKKGHYFGPFASALAVKRTITSLQKAFLLRTCTDSFYKARTRPCMLHQIKRCAAPCTGEISIDAYGELVNEARQFLSGRSQNVQDHLQADMNAAAEALDFERAALLRDRLSALALVQSQSDVVARGVEEANVFAIAHEAGQFCVQVFFFRAYQNWGNHAFRPRADASLSDAEVLEAFISQFYEDRTPPRLVLLSHELSEPEVMKEALSARAGRKVSIETPQRGEKKDLVQHALNNAREALGRQLAEQTGAKVDRAGRVVVERDCSLADHPEIFVMGDLAHFQHGVDAQPLPALAPVAMQQGRHVAKVLRLRLGGDSRSALPFEYLDKGSMAVIGRRRAVAQVWKLRLSGLFAWLAWLFIHVLYLAEFQNRVLVMIQWGWNFVTRNRAARLITGDLAPRASKQTPAERAAAAAKAPGEASRG